MGVKVTGVRETQRAMKATKPKYADSMAASIYVEALAIMAKSIPQAPVDTGRMRQSHFVALPEKTTRGPVVRLGYGTR